MTYINRGFLSMLPQNETIDKEDKHLYDYKIEFTLFKKVFTFRINVRQRE